MKHKLFDTFIWKSKINYKQKDKLKEKLLKDFSENKNNFVTGWDCFVHSSFLDQEKNTLPEDLLDIIQGKVTEYLDECPDELKIKGTYIISNIWYNIYEKNYFQEPHVHNSLFSGCYYLKFNKEKHHQTTFYNPNYKLNYSKVEESSYFCFESDCEEDDIIIFPSNLMHGTKGLKEKSSEESRITVSFNVVNPNIALNEQLRIKRVSYN